MKLMRIITCVLLVTCCLIQFSGCKKSNDSVNNNNNVTTGPIAKLLGNWATPAWGGTVGDTLKLSIAGSTAGNGKILSIATTSWNYSVGEVILSNIVPAVVSGVTSTTSYTGTGVYKYDVGNSVSSNSTVTITLSNNFTQMQVAYAATGLSYYYVKQ